MKGFDEITSSKVTDKGTDSVDDLVGRNSDGSPSGQYHTTTFDFDPSGNRSKETPSRPSK
jgi:hypothetical protein